jgi:NAD(P)H-dependent flavin oxidoreductase YrpB (nitropropane dioxygenase family)
MPLYTSLAAADFDSTIRTVVFSGRPMRAFATPYVANWERNRQEEIRDLTSRGIIPIEHDLDRLHEEGKLTGEIEDQAAARYSDRLFLRDRIC